ncbi:unnamed protein product [Lathyrus sativus]|nr:unnamed protein product [Lathyrus sativus]
MNLIRSSGITPNVVPWPTRISGCSQNGKCTNAPQVFNQMRAENVEPPWQIGDDSLRSGDAITLTTLLSGCKKSGLVEERWRYLDSTHEDQ